MAPSGICVEQEKNLPVTVIEPDLVVVVYDSPILKETFTKTSFFCIYLASLMSKFTFLSVGSHHLSQVATLRQALDMTCNEEGIEGRSGVAHGLEEVLCSDDNNSKQTVNLTGKIVGNCD